MVGIDSDNVVEPGDRPIGSKGAIGGVMDRGLLSQPAKSLMMRAGLEPVCPPGIQLFNGRRPCIIGFALSLACDPAH
jgi:hypothetical protein